MSLRVPNELSARHLPEDLSDQSVSFQIPPQVDSSNLLDDVAEDFFAVAMDGINTPMPPKHAVNSPLRPSPTLVSTNPVVQDPRLIVRSKSITPLSAGLAAPHAKPGSMDSRTSRPTERQAASGIDASDSGHMSPCQEKVETVPPGCSSAKADVTNHNSAKSMLGVKRKQIVELPPKENTIRRGAKPRPKSAVVGGGIVKPPKPIAAMSKERNHRHISVSPRPVPGASLTTECPDGEDTSGTRDEQSNESLTSSGSGVAQTLLMLGQRLMGTLTSRDDAKVEKQIQEATELVGEPQKHAQILENGPQRNADQLTLSQLSPRKERKESTDNLIPVSPMRPSKKRASVDSESTDDKLRNDAQKERKVDLDQVAGSSNRTLQPSRRKNNDASSSSQLLAKRLKTKTAPPINAQKGKARVHMVVSSRAVLGGSEGFDRADKANSDAGRRLHASHPLPPQQVGRKPDFDTSTAVPPLHKATIPIGFRFEVDSRMQARKTEVEEKAQSLRKHSKVDYNSGSMGISQSASRRAPVMPSAFSFSTETRAKERERFDEQVRLKQQELERQLEERRRERLLEEEREIKELRKRAVPKANQVPEWYATMPKRKGRDA